MLPPSLVVMTLDYLAHLRSESARFVEVLRDVDPTTRVPTCPDWDVADLIHHLSDVHWSWATIVRERLQDPSSLSDLERGGEPADQLDRFAAYTAELVSALEQADDVTPVWTWSRDHSVGFVRRRMAQETLVHRFDADAAAGVIGDADHGLAEDGVDEAMQWFHGGCPAWASFTPGGPVGTLHTTDTDRTWLFRVGTVGGTRPNGQVVEAEPAFDLLEDGSAEPLFEISAPARDLLAWLWNRPVITPVTRTGAVEDLERVDAVVASGID